ncbi:nitrous oxide reductase accessory protein NosL [Natronolimnohabitans sp. A-GB9]|uniref:nitrous oxide reductase accessory protein NosL n=1 Tax=Natronolimnohabitans sp. A-GB9 TaxID=3069757 RepID=UPI0027ADDDC1|nr:nitrous oxide reductase accessory protein NosL [Natronolimnohabitans sp. A-GB9]MDQ2050069.1 nitrous oxide reductase accessory protein NosL [Natronolimnohabitans sp. A-GB9]
MERRNFLLGSTAAGAGILFGTGAFSAAGVSHGVSIETGDGYLHVDPNPDYEGNAGTYVDDSDGPLELTIDDLGEHGWVRFDDLLRVTNTGTQPVSVYVEPQDWLGDDADAVLDYRYDGDSIVGEDNDVEIEDVRGDNSLAVTVRADATGHDDLEDVLPDTDADAGSHTVTFVAEAEEPSGGGLRLETTIPGQVELDEEATLEVELENLGNEADESAVTVTIDDETEYDEDVTVDADATWTGSFEFDTGEEGTVDWKVETDADDASGTLEIKGEIEELVDVEVTDTITPREVAEVTATVTNDADEQRSGTVTLDVDQRLHPGDGLDVDLEADVDSYPEQSYAAGDPDYHYIDRGEYPQDLLEQDVTVDAGDSETVTFDVPAAYKNLELGDLKLKENDLEVTVDLDGETDRDDDTLTIEDATVEFFQPDDDKWCPVCNMATEQYEAWHAIISHEDGSRPEFCSTGCAVQYWVKPGWFFENMRDDTYRGMTPATEEDLVTMWAPDFTDVSGEDLDEHPGYEAFIDLRDGYIVLDGDTVSKFSTPMGGGSPVCFADYDDAVDYVNGDLENLPEDVDMSNVTEDDIVTLEELDEDNTAVYDGSGRITWRG